MSIMIDEETEETFVYKKDEPLSGCEPQYEMVTFTNNNLTEELTCISDWGRSNFSYFGCAYKFDGHDYYFMDDPNSVEPEAQQHFEQKIGNAKIMDESGFRAFVKTRQFLNEKGKPFQPLRYTSDTIHYE